MLHIKRIYEKPAKSDGARVLVDRLWPRGVRKEEAALDAWLKEIAPSTELRQWFSHKPERFEAFSKKYTAELRHNLALSDIKQLIADHKTITLLYAAKNPAINHAVVLQKFLEELV